jgi:hypothetical protein
MHMPLNSRIIFYILTIYMAIGAHVFDWQTHIHSPRWPPHAKFHSAHTMSISVVLCLLTCFIASRKATDKALTLIATVGFASAFWVSQFCAILYPGTAFVDPEYDTPSAYILGFHAQPFLDVVAICLILFAAWLAARRTAVWATS